MAAAAKSLGHPDAAKEICSQVLRRFENRSKPGY